MLLETKKFALKGSALLGRLIGSGPRVLRFLFISYNKEAVEGMEAEALGNLTASASLFITS